MTLPSAVMFWNRLKPLEHHPDLGPVRASSFSRSPLSRRESRYTLPASTGSSSARHRSSVDFPEPDGPMITFTSPRPTSNVTPRSTSSPS